MMKQEEQSEEEEYSLTNDSSNSSELDHLITPHHFEINPFDLSGMSAELIDYQNTAVGLPFIPISDDQSILREENQLFDDLGNQRAWMVHTFSVMPSHVDIQISTRDEEYIVVPEVLFSSLRYVLSVNVQVEDDEKIGATLQLVEDEDNYAVVTKQDGKVLDPEPGLVALSNDNNKDQYTTEFKVKVKENSSNRNGIKFAFKITFFSLERGQPLFCAISPGFLVKSRREPKSKRATDPTVAKKQKKDAKSSSALKASPPKSTNPIVPKSYQTPFPPLTSQSLRCDSPVDRLINLAISNSNASQATSVPVSATPTNNAPSTPPQTTRLSKDELRECMAMADDLRDKLSKLSEKDRRVAILYLQNELFEQTEE